MIEQENPFALVRASDYTDQQINSLWVEIGAAAINSVIEPRSRRSKFILGGKGSGKTHLLRYHSYSVSRLRLPEESGIALLMKQKFLAIFLRATGVDAARFESNSQDMRKWQQLFGVYLELRLVEGVLEVLCDVKDTSCHEAFNDRAFIKELSKTILDPNVGKLNTVSEFHNWVVSERRLIDDAVNNAAFTDKLDIKIPFSIGSLCIPISKAFGIWHQALNDFPLIYLIDEIENFSMSQQQVVNSLIRYGEGLTTFRVTGRLYARKTSSTMANGEENREGAEFTTTYLDDVLREYTKYPDFATRFVVKRLISAGLLTVDKKTGASAFDPRLCFEEICSDDYYAKAIKDLKLDVEETNFIKFFIESLQSRKDPNGRAVNDTAHAVASVLTDGLPLLFQKLNLLLFCKKCKKNTSIQNLAGTIREDSLMFQNGVKGGRPYYATAYGHYKNDLFAQLCRESKKAGGVPYAGFDTFVKMSSGNPRNLLILLGRAYDIATFKGIDFIREQKLSVSLQTEAAIEAARFIYESDTNFGNLSEQAREATTRLAFLLRTARYALNIPEVSPLAVSFADEEIGADARKIMHSALNYSFIFEIYEGRPDRNSQRVNRKIQLNPLLSAKWGLPTARRGDLSLSSELVNAIFDPRRTNDFAVLLKSLDFKWNNPFKSVTTKIDQPELF